MLDAIEKDVVEKVDVNGVDLSCLARRVYKAIEQAMESLCLMYDVQP